MKETTVSKGKRAELRAEQLLMSKGYRILVRNYRCTRGEIDIVAEDGTVLVFVEVRCRSKQMDTALESVNKPKMRRIVMAARHYLATHPTYLPCRFDVVGICGDPDSPTALALHLPSAFTLEDI